MQYLPIEFLMHAPFTLTELCLSFNCLAFFNFYSINVSCYLHISSYILSHVGDLLRTSLIGTFLIKKPISTKCANETFWTMETSYSTQSVHGAPPWSPHHLQQPREGRTVKEGVLSINNDSLCFSRFIMSSFWCQHYMRQVRQVL